ncbi:translation initiation factor IF-3 [Hyalangium versicolor]|uniref:translation initiation factor IF-3 n=1 Tax=Hyalangium versicolor TaxID=2861190 RepID=UPI002103D831|nr:translation initiation factor IF-3 [Hyalangium versicolor]
MEDLHIVRDQRTNRRIRAREVRVVGPAGEQLGVLTIEQALERAQSEGMDLVEVNPMAKPPVCKIMDYGKFKYEEKKKASEAKKKQVVVHLKEVKLRPKTEEHDYEFKVRNIKRFLEEGNKAKVTIVFRGREITHKELGSAILDDVNKDLKDVAVVEQVPRMEGRQMFMILAPNPKVAQRARDQARQQAEAAAKAEAAAGKKPEGNKVEGNKVEGTKPAGGKPDGKPDGERQETRPAGGEAAPPAAPQSGPAAGAAATGGTK